MKNIFFLVAILILSCQLHAQNIAGVSNTYLASAITHAVEQYYKQSPFPKGKHDVIIVKIFKINESSGIFSMKYIYSHVQYKNFYPKYYLSVNNSPILIKVDESINNDLTEFGIHAINENVKNIILTILPSPKTIIAGQPPLYLTCRYKKHKIKTTFHLSYSPTKYRFY
jgi:hypothetical protein